MAAPLDRKEIVLLFFGVLIGVGVTMLYDMFQFALEENWGGKSVHTIGVAAIASLAGGFLFVFFFLLGGKHAKRTDQQQ